MDNKEEIKNVHKNKRRRFFKGFLITLGVITVIVIALGFIFPGLLWTRDLGVKYTKDDYNSIINKLNYKTNNLVFGEYVYSYGEAESVDTPFTSEELTAFVNENGPGTDKLKNFQIKINNDATIEIVCNINVDFLLNDLLKSKYSREKIESEVPGIGILPDNINLYIKFSGSVTNNKISLNINSISIQGVTVPDSFISDNQVVYEIENGVNNMISDFNTETGSNFNRIFVDNGQIRVQGAMPSTIERIKK